MTVHEADLSQARAPSRAKPSPISEARCKACRSPNCGTATSISKARAICAAPEESCATSKTSSAPPRAAKARADSDAWSVSISPTSQQSEVPSLEAFAERFPEGFYGEAELAKLWAEEYGKPARAQLRRARLIERQLSAITWLENIIGEDPRAGDALSAWLEEKTAARLNQAGLITLQDLVSWINRKGARWWVRHSRHRG